MRSKYQWVFDMLAAGAGALMVLLTGGPGWAVAMTFAIIYMLLPDSA